MQHVINSEIVFQRYSRLPETLKNQVSDYIDFLLTRYSENKTDTIEISEEIQSALSERSAYSKAHPETRKSWNEVKTRIKNKRK